MTDRDTTTRTRARAPGVGGVFHRMAVHDRVLRPDSERTTVATTKCTKGGCKLDGGRRMPGAGLSRRSPRKAPLGQSAFQPYWGKLAVRNDRGDRGNVGIIRSPIRASILPDSHYRTSMLRQKKMIRPKSGMVFKRLGRRTAALRRLYFWRSCLASEIRRRSDRRPGAPFDSGDTRDLSTTEAGRTL